MRHRKHKDETKLNYTLPANGHWTIQAAECYNIGCKCSECLIFNVIGNRCQMKKTVISLVRKYGKPRNTINSKGNMYYEETC